MAWQEENTGMDILANRYLQFDGFLLQNVCGLLPLTSANAENVWFHCICCATGVSNPLTAVQRTSKKLFGICIY